MQHMFQLWRKNLVLLPSNPSISILHIDATLDGKDSLVIHPTGSEKSLCFQYQGISITLTISLMQDQVHKLTEIGIPSVYLGSAQMDKRLEACALMPESEQLLISVTPEWVTKHDNQVKLQALAKAGKLSLFAIDEAHLFTERRDFRSVYQNLRELKLTFPSIPIMAQAATASTSVKDDIKLLVRYPTVENVPLID